MNQHYFYPSSRPRKNQSLDPTAKKTITSRHRILTLQHESSPQSLLPSLKKQARPQFKLNHLKTEVSENERTVIRLPVSTKNKTMIDEYEDYAEHMAMQKRELSLKMENFFEKPLSKEQFIKKFECTEDEYQKYGSRFPKGYSRVKILGRGGFSLIWLGECVTKKEKFAIKQIPLANQYKTHVKEINFCEFFFERGGRVKPKFANHNGVQQLSRMIKYDMTQTDTWLFYEVCGVSIGTQIYDFSTEILGDKKVYKLHIQKLALMFRTNKKQLYYLIQKLTECIDLLQSQDIVHSDIKSENILVLYDDQSLSVKLIDYGSSFQFSRLQREFSMATPEYMCPELLDFIVQENGAQKILPINLDASYKRPWVIDMWGLGCVLLEILSGLPLWMSLETLVTNIHGQTRLDTGLFAVKGRYFDKIIQKQIKVCNNLEEILKERTYSGTRFFNIKGIEIDDNLIILLRGMLQINPAKRLSPEQIINFCKTLI